MKYPLFKVSMPTSVTKRLADLLYAGYIAEGEQVKELCKMVATYIGNPNTVLVNSCTSALTMAYAVAGVGPGTEVITTPLTSIATNQPIKILGGKVVWADVEPDTGLSSLEDIRGLINERTRAIVALHKDGDLMDMDALMDLKSEFPHIRIVEDAAHAFGAAHQGKMIGAAGDITCFSFQSIKHITTGDGGAVSCQYKADYERLHKMKWLGMDRNSKTPTQDDVTEIGFKANMNNISATIGIEQMAIAEDILERHNKNGRLLDVLLQGTPGLNLLRRPENGDFRSYWVYTMRVEDRDGLSSKLSEAGVQNMVVHPRNDVYSLFKESLRPLPGVDLFSSQELSIPCGWWMDDDDITTITDIIKRGW